MLRITRTLDLFEPDPFTGRGVLHARRFYLDDRGHAWTPALSRSRWGRGQAPEPGELYSLEGALQRLRHDRAAYGETRRSPAERQRAHPARWRVVLADHDSLDEPRADVLELAALPEPDDRHELRRASLDGWTLTDVTEAARAEIARGRALAAGWTHDARRRTRYGAYDWHDRPGFLRLVRPSRTTRTATAYYAERAGRWRRVADPAGVWRQRDTVEVEVRLNDPRLAVAVYKRRGRVETFQHRRACRVWYGYDTVLDSGTERRAVRAPAQQAAALRALMDRARADLAPEIEAERRRRRDRAAARRASHRAAGTDEAQSQLTLF